MFSIFFNFSIIFIAIYPFLTYKIFQFNNFYPILIKLFYNFLIAYLNFSSLVLNVGYNGKGTIPFSESKSKINDLLELYNVG